MERGFDDHPWRVLDPIAPILENVKQDPEHTALEFEEQVFSYADLGGEALRIGIFLRKLASGDRVGILAERSPLAYCGILGALLAGKSFVPLNPRFPIERTRYMIEAANVGTLLCDEEQGELLNGFPDALLEGRSLLFPDEIPAEVEGQQSFSLSRREFPSTDDPAPLVRRDPEDPAYVMFTSGSTGSPKKIELRNRNLAAWLSNTRDLLRTGRDDRFTQTFDLTFDLSVHDIFLALASGGTICIPNTGYPLQLYRYIKARKPTVWFSVPSVALLLQKMRVLRPNAFPSIRLSLFCGEALSYGLAQAWKNAAPGSELINLYGPTEATISITAYRPEEQEIANAPSEELLPIGKPFPGHSVRIVREDGEVAQKGELGELWVKGPQVAKGWDDQEGWYHTGDLVQENADGELLFQGRKDDQVKVQGYRVALQEVEHALRKVSGVQEVAVVAVQAEGGELRLYGFVSNEAEADLSELHQQLQERLPWYMLPSEIRMLEGFPLNPNGKLDRSRLLRSLKENG